MIANVIVLIWICILVSSTSVTSRYGFNFLCWVYGWRGGWRVVVSLQNPNFDDPFHEDQTAITMSVDWRQLVQKSEKVMNFRWFICLQCLRILSFYLLNCNFTQPVEAIISRSDQDHLRSSVNSLRTGQPESVNKYCTNSKILRETSLFSKQYQYFNPTIQIVLSIFCNSSIDAFGLIVQQ